MQDDHQLGARVREVGAAHSGGELRDMLHGTDRSRSSRCRTMARQLVSWSDLW
jgi:hypothetical protein